MIDIIMMIVSISGAISALYLLVGSFVITAKIRKNDSIIAARAKKLGMRQRNWPIDV